jgi:beta-galactosidase/beta-glucuronidase
MQVLDSQWTLATDPLNHGREQRWFAQPQAEAVAVPIPSVIQQFFLDYHGVVWYWHSFRPIRQATANERYLLRFGAVDYLAEVWLNGEAVGSHEGADTPFMLDVTTALKGGEDNLLAVRVLNPADERIDGITLMETPHRNKTIQNYQPGRGYNTGGIVLPVELLVLPAIRIVDLFVRSDSTTGQMRVEVTVRNDQSLPAMGQLTASVEPSGEGGRLDYAQIEATFSPGEHLYDFDLTVNRPRLWDLHDPYLYRVTTSLSAQDANNASRLPRLPCGRRLFPAQWAAHLFALDSYGKSLSDGNPARP